ncbi:hypothetical protein [Streptomyces sp.]|uniref:hypothetical protein n=1 Tax=Streptomyces sp. TaxID=1931 RepID=UPI002F429C60
MSRETDHDDGVRRLVRGWLDGSPRPEDGACPDTPALDVPPTDAHTVIATVRDLLGPQARHATPHGLTGLTDRRFADLRLLAEAMVLDEHPSAPGWSAAERHEAACWTAVLIERQGDDGVERLLDALRRTPRTGGVTRR